MQENKSKFFSVLWEAIKKFCTTNVAIKIVSLLFAMLLWGQNSRFLCIICGIPVNRMQKRVYGRVEK